LRKALTGVDHRDGHSYRHNQAADGQSCSSGKARESPTSFDTDAISNRAFYDSCRFLTTRRIGRQRGGGTRRAVNMSVKPVSLG
jgi:hypothetical protein